MEKENEWKGSLKMKRRFQTADLRFVLRDGKKILQQGYRTENYDDGDTEGHSYKAGYDWVDVPLVIEEDPKKD